MKDDPTAGLTTDKLRRGLYSNSMLPELVLMLMRQVHADLLARDPDWPYSPRIPRPRIPYPPE